MKNQNQQTTQTESIVQPVQQTGFQTSTGAVFFLSKGEGEGEGETVVTATVPVQPTPDQAVMTPHNAGLAGLAVLVVGAVVLAVKRFRS